MVAVNMFCSNIGGNRDRYSEEWNFEGPVITTVIGLWYAVPSLIALIAAAPIIRWKAKVAGKGFDN